MSENPATPETPAASGLQAAMQKAWKAGCFVEKKNGIYTLFRRLVSPHTALAKRVFIGKSASAAGIMRLIDRAC